MRNLLSVAATVATLGAGAQPVVELVPVMNTQIYITDIVHAGDDRVFVVAKNGIIRIIEDSVLLPQPFLDINAQTWGSGELGCLGLAFDPLYEQNGRFYVHYTANPGTVLNRISRFTVSADPNVADPLSEEILWTYPQPAIIHKGGDLEFGPDGLLYISLGDAGTYVGSQDVSNPYGSILRIDVSGDQGYTIPPDNPFATASADTLPEIWAYGLRNPYRFTIDPVTGMMWIGDVGWQSWEEIDVWPIADNTAPNFGWPCMEGNDIVPNAPGCEMAPPFIDPVQVQPNGAPWCAIIGGRVYRGSAYPSLYGRYIYADHCAGLIHSLRPDGNEGYINEELASGLNFGMTTIGNDVDGELYLGMSNGMLYRIVDPLSVGMGTVVGTSLEVFPNPTSDHITIRGMQAGTRVALLDAQGRPIIEEQIGDEHHYMHLADLPAGIYTLISRDMEGVFIGSGRIAVVHGH